MNSLHFQGLRMRENVIKFTQKTFKLLTVSSVFGFQLISGIESITFFKVMLYIRLTILRMRKIFFHI